MTNELLSVADQEEALSRAYARAIAARAGYTTADYDYDRTGVDLRVQSQMRPAIEFQLKATVSLNDPTDGKRKNYDELIELTQTPRILLVLDLPRDRDEWMTVTADHLKKACPKSKSLETTNVSSVTVKPETNVFDIESLRSWSSREGG